jgi:hypothetical protein
MPLKDLARLGTNKLIENDEEKVSGKHERNLKTNTREMKVSSPIEAKDEDFINSDELQDNFNSHTNDFSLNLSSQRNKTRHGRKSDFAKTNSGTKFHQTSHSNDKKIPKKSKNVPPPTLVDKPWDEFDIKVMKKEQSVVDDIFADMAPTLSETRKAPVKGTSLYSDTLAVVTDSVSEVSGLLIEHFFTRIAKVWGGAHLYVSYIRVYRA